MFRFEPCGWQKTRTSSQLSIAISLPGTFIDTSTAGTGPADRHCRDMIPGCDATPDQREPHAAVGLLRAHAHRAVDPVAVRVDVDQLGLVAGGDAVVAVAVDVAGDADQLGAPVEDLDEPRPAVALAQAARGRADAHEADGAVQFADGQLLACGRSTRNRPARCCGCSSRSSRCGPGSRRSAAARRSGCCCRSVNGVASRISMMSFCGCPKPLSAT